jgi:hypothetical protein
MSEGAAQVVKRPSIERTELIQRCLLFSPSSENSFGSLRGQEEIVLGGNLIDYDPDHLSNRKSVFVLILGERGGQRRIVSARRMATDKDRIGNLVADTVQGAPATLETGGKAVLRGEAVSSTVGRDLNITRENHAIAPCTGFYADAGRITRALYFEILHARQHELDRPAGCAR